MNATRAHILISGRVQGVVFRAYTREEANRLGVKGWVRNLPDGRVEAVVEGEREKLEELVRWCHKGSPYARVDEVEVTWEEVASGEFDSFGVRF